MKSYKKIKIIAAALLLSALTADICAYDLPVRNVNGVDCYYYKVEKHETVYGVAHKLGITRDDIIANNPWAADGLKNGQILYFPASDFPGVFGSPADASVSQSEQESTTDEKIETSDRLAEQTGLTAVTDSVTASANDTIAIPAELPAPESVEPGSKRTVVLIQPFMLNEEKESKAAANIADFYKGFLIAADTLLNDLPDVNLLVYDTRNDAGRLSNYLAREPRLVDADIIIAPDNAEHLAMIAQFASDKQIPVINPFVVRDTTFMSNPFLLQANIPSAQMYETAAKAYVERLEGSVPVIIKNETGSMDKQQFIDVFVSKLAEQGITPVYLTYSGTLHESDITDALGMPDATSSYTFIPLSGNLSEFLKFSSGISSFKDTAAASGGTVKVFGYPEWVTFRNDSEDMLHNLDTSIYSRFFSDSHDFDTRNVLDSYHKWYGNSPSEGVPSQALLGYDLGRFIFENLAQNRTFFGQNSRPVEGVQSMFSFVKANDSDDSGAYNNAMFLIRFLPGGSYSKIAL